MSSTVVVTPGIGIWGFKCVVDQGCAQCLTKSTFVAVSQSKGSQRPGDYCYQPEGYQLKGIFSCEQGCVVSIDFKDQKERALKICIMTNFSWGFRTFVS